MRTLPHWLFMILMNIFVLNSGVAQEFRIYTKVMDLSAGDGGKPVIISKSMTLYHAGKVYDYLEDQEETIIHEPMHRRFLILNRRHNLATEITHDEIRRYLGLANDEARKLISEWQRDGANRKSDIEMLEFQLLPEFQLGDHLEQKKLSLISPKLRYDVSTAVGPSAEVVQAYLKSADWTAQLNSVLNPQSLLPEPRLRLNDELRERGVLPVEVELQIAGEHPIHLKATHVWTWKLHGEDRAFIESRETLLRQPSFQKVPFRDFQREVLTASARK